MKIWTFFLSFMLLCMISCQQQGTTDAAAVKSPEEASPSQNFYPAVSNEIIAMLYQKSNKMDVLFNDAPVSLSQSTAKDVKGQLSFLSPGSVPKPLPCRETANGLFQADGDILADIRYYITDGCRYALFYENGKPAYGAIIGDQGLNFYRSVLNQAQPQ